MKALIYVIKITLLSLLVIFVDLTLPSPSHYMPTIVRS